MGNSGSGSIATWASLGVILAAALALRLYHIDRTSLTLDEFWNAELSTGRGTLHETIQTNQVFIPPPGTALSDAPAWWNIPGSLDRVTHPPLFSIALRWWREVFGQGDAAMRAYSAVLGAAAIVPFFLTARLLHGTRVALWSAALLAVAATPIAGAREVRPYSQLIFLCMLLAWQLVRIEKLGGSWHSAAFLAITALAAMFTHYFSAPILLMLAVYAWLRLDRADFRRLAVTGTLAAGAFAVTWLPSMLAQQAEVGESAARWLRDIYPDPVTMTLLRLADAPMRLLMLPRRDVYPAPYFAIGFVLVAALLARRQPQLLLWLLIMLGNVGFVCFLDLYQGTRMLDLIRYALPSAPPMCALLAVVLGSLHRWASAGMLALLLTALAIAVPSAYELDEPDFRPLARWLDQHVQPDDIVVFPRFHDWEWHAGFLYVTWSHYSSRQPVRCAFVDLPVGQELLAQLRQAPAVWVVSRWTGSATPPVLPDAQPDTHFGIPYVGEVTRFTFRNPAQPAEP